MAYQFPLLVDYMQAPFCFNFQFQVQSQKGSHPKACAQRDAESWWCDTQSPFARMTQEAAEQGHLRFKPTQHPQTLPRLASVGLLHICLHQPGPLCPLWAGKLFRAPTTCAWPVKQGAAEFFLLLGASGQTEPTNTDTRSDRNYS